MIDSLFKVEDYCSWKYKDIEEDALPLGVIDEVSLFPSIALEYAFGRADMENDLIFNEESRKEKHETFKNFSL